MTTTQKQWQLRYLGYYSGRIDGIWGRLSIEATEKFQNAFDLGNDGIFGPMTESKSISLIRSIQKAITDGSIAIDGLAGPETQRRTIQWQAAHGLPTTGEADEATRRAIASQKKEEPEGDWWKGIKHFSRNEFRCPCGRCGGFPVEPDRELVELADEVREELGVMPVSSGVRCQEHNDELPGSVPNSRHVRAKAMDFRVEGKTSAEVLAHVRTKPNVRYAYAIDELYIHMDVE